MPQQVFQQHLEREGQRTDPLEAVRLGFLEVEIVISLLAHFEAAAAVETVE